MLGDAEDGSQTDRRLGPGVEWTLPIEHGTAAALSDAWGLAQNGILLAINHQCECPRLDGWPRMRILRSRRRRRTELGAHSVDIVISGIQGHRPCPPHCV